MFRFLFGKSSKPPKRNRPGKSKPSYRAADLPQGLGLQAGIPLARLVAKLDSALPPDYVERLQYRVKIEHPLMSDDEFSCKWFELKRFFLMNLILKRTPMFSHEIDAIWHEMLMFTREYQRFGEQFAGGVIHHAPEREPKEMPGERAWFDWVYAHLFEFTPTSARCWNGFFRNPLDKERTDLLRGGNEEEIAELWFDMEQAKRYPEVAETIGLLVAQAISEAEKAANSRRFEDTGWQNSLSGPNSMVYLAGAMMFFSISEAHDYTSGMDSYMPENQEDTGKDRTSNCSASGCGGNSSGDNSGDTSSGGDSGSSSNCSSGSGSSCSSSSCGSSCSS
ncbi:hypothetical protein GCM10008018_13480 [Paenibacillus marchantiophytorum]|uniref:Uncharacterized protein n=1 Tax=Paenibacillus marchantiophytorum TaxID=1619310 RepID=A0ABQ2BR81_9BACL|nr:hypothetical protein [Paenibacillus marchantiophytorum]GGI45702.1 hypothetical protein GCM10008018_13480 [Paenibacillus marchantiophytorum]